MGSFRFLRRVSTRRCHSAPFVLALALCVTPLAAAPGVRIQVDGRVHPVSETAASVGEALRAADVSLGVEDAVTPAPDTLLSPNCVIVVKRVQFREIVSEVRVPYRTLVRQATPSNRPFHPTVTREGVVGLKQVTIRIRLEDGVERGRETLADSLVRAPVDQIVTSRTPARLLSRGAYTGKRTLNLLSSAYDPGPGSCGKHADGKTTNGKRAGYGVIAVDPRVIPLGVKLYVPGYGYGVAADVGSAIKGNRIDLGFNSRSGAMAWGKRWVRVQVLD